MKAREKLLITISLLACGVAIGVFALVSLGHFIYTPNRTNLPVVGKMYQSTVQQVALLEPVPVPQTPPSAINNPNPGPTTDDAAAKAAEQAAASAKIQSSLSKNHKNDKKGHDNDPDYDQLKKALAAIFGLL